MKVSEDFYPSKYLSAEDLKGKSVRLTISHIERQEFNDGQSKPVIHFERAKKAFVSNRTNTFEISGVFGDETDRWIGKDVILTAARVPFQGKMVNSIRVSIPDAVAAPAEKARVATPILPAKPDSGIGSDLDDEIDF